MTINRKWKNYERSRPNNDYQQNSTRGPWVSRVLATVDSFDMGKVEADPGGHLWRGALRQTNPQKLNASQLQRTLGRVRRWGGVDQCGLAVVGTLVLCRKQHGEGCSTAGRHSCIWMSARGAGPRAARRLRRVRRLPERRAALAPTRGR